MKWHLESRDFKFRKGGATTEPTRLLYLSGHLTVLPHRFLVLPASLLSDVVQKTAHNTHDDLKFSTKRIDLYKAPL